MVVDGAEIIGGRTRSLVLTNSPFKEKVSYGGTWCVFDDEQVRLIFKPIHSSISITLLTQTPSVTLSLYLSLSPLSNRPLPQTLGLAHEVTTLLYLSLLYLLVSLSDLPPSPQLDFLPFIPKMVFNEKCNFKNFYRHPWLMIKLMLEGRAIAKCAV